MQNVTHTDFVINYLDLLLTETYTAAKDASVACCDGKDFLEQRKAFRISPGITTALNKV